MKLSNILTESAYDTTLNKILNSVKKQLEICIDRGGTYPIDNNNSISYRVFNLSLVDLKLTSWISINQNSSDCKISSESFRVVLEKIRDRFEGCNTFDIKLTDEDKNTIRNHDIHLYSDDENEMIKRIINDHSVFGLKLFNLDINPKSDTDFSSRSNIDYFQYLSPDLRNEITQDLYYKDIDEYIKSDLGAIDNRLPHFSDDFLDEERREMKKTKNIYTFLSKGKVTVYDPNNPSAEPNVVEYVLPKKDIYFYLYNSWTGYIRETNTIKPNFRKFINIRYTNNNDGNFNHLDLKTQKTIAEKFEEWGVELQY